VSRLPFMNRSFAPSFQHFHKDVERYLTSEGKREKNEHGQTVYRGYQAAKHSHPWSRNFVHGIGSGIMTTICWS
jgi:hypothetical protein